MNSIIKWNQIQRWNSRECGLQFDWLKILLNRSNPGYILIFSRRVITWSSQNMVLDCVSFQFDFFLFNRRKLVLLARLFCWHGKIHLRFDKVSQFMNDTPRIRLHPRTRTSISYMWKNTGCECDILINDYGVLSHHIRPHPHQYSVTTDHQIPIAAVSQQTVDVSLRAWHLALIHDMSVRECCVTPPSATLQLHHGGL